MVNYGQLSAPVPWLTGTPTLVLRANTDVQQLASDAYYTRVTNYVAIIGYTILLWDHIITFDDEVKFVWKRSFGSWRRNPSTYLFLINRYFTPIAFIGNFAAYFSHWSPNTCRKFVRYEGSCTVIALGVAELYLLQRVRALYAASQHRYLVPSCLFGVFLLQTGVMAWLLTHGVYVSHDDANDRACTMIFDPKLGSFWPSLSAWLPLIFDTLVITATLYKCIPQARINSASHLFRTLLKDGLLYYTVLFAVNLVLAIMIIAAPDPIKNITAQLEQLLTVAMISRITLSLRREGRRQSSMLSSEDYKSHPHPHLPSTHDSWYAPARHNHNHKPDDYISTSALMRDTGTGLSLSCRAFGLDSLSPSLRFRPDDSILRGAGMRDSEIATTDSLEFAIARGARARRDHGHGYGTPDVKRGRRVPVRPSTGECSNSNSSDVGREHEHESESEEGYGYGDEWGYGYGSGGTTSIGSFSTTPRHIEYASFNDGDGVGSSFPSAPIPQDLEASPEPQPDTAKFIQAPIQTPSASFLNRNRIRKSNPELEPPGITSTPVTRNTDTEPLHIQNVDVESESASAGAGGSLRWDETSSLAYELRAMRPAPIPRVHTFS